MTQIKMKMLGDELFEAANAAGHSVTIDTGPTGSKNHQSPVELLLSSLAACASVDVIAILKKRKKQVDSLTVETNGERNETPPRFFKSIHLRVMVQSPDVTAEELEKATRLSIEKYCSVAASLRSEVTFSVQVQR